jgi:L-asparaginase / beta-aspartyl-peptidase
MMRSLMAALLALSLSACVTTRGADGRDGRDGGEPAEWVLAIHGGAGVITRGSLTPEKEAAIRERLDAALMAGGKVLESGGTSLDAVTAAILVLEDSEYFNAGHGAVLTEEGRHELDASIMWGSERDAGSVAGVTSVKNPILAARAVMENSRHVMFAGEGADDFARAQGLELVDNIYFTTPARREALDRVLERRRREAGDNMGTVGAVAIDRAGNYAAGTSTGGMTAKARGRVGDSPLIGAATYAQNGVCAVSATGHGEYFIRVGVAKTICTRIDLSGDSGDVAARKALSEVAQLGGDGGVIVIDDAGEVAFVFDTEGMYRGQAGPEGREVAIYGEGE